MSKIVLSLLVDNQAGVLSRVAGLFSRRGYNIDSLTVGETENPNLSRMTIVSSGEPEVLVQIQKQLKKLIDVKEIKVLPNDMSVCRELILIRVEAGFEERPQVTAIADIFRAKVVDVSDTSMMMELTGGQAKLEAFIKLLGQFKITELARTGVTGLSRGFYGD
ncbi:MAG: acetolactate synthase small subunit [Lachnospiraceae bacterium]